MKKIITLAAVILLTSLNAKAQDEIVQKIDEVAQSEDICAKLVRFEALKSSELSKCRQAEKDPEFKRKSCNARPDQGFCMVKFEAERNIVPVEF